jgi:hypothetical protein
MPSPRSTTPLDHQMPKTERSWSQTLMFPQQCIRLEVVIHQDHDTDRWCLEVEGSDPHTRELLWLEVSPAMRQSPVYTVGAEVAVRLRSILLSLMDPEPF